MGFSHDSHPFVGRTDDNPKKWIIGGFHGHGMVRIWLCAKALVEQILAEDQGEVIAWPDWMPRGYIHSADRIEAIGEVKEYLDSVS
jgi:glycine/D-amino acid oxidase-like deaminating enzyme